MTTSKPWGDYTQMLRAEIERARLGNHRDLARLAAEHIEEARSWVHPTPEIDKACGIAIRDIENYAAAIAHRGLHFSLSDPADLQAQNLALLAVSWLEERFEAARPSDKAIKLRLGW